MNSEEMEIKIKNNIRKCIALGNIKEEMAANTLKRKKTIYKLLPSCSILIICGVVLVNGYGNLKIKEAKSSENIIKQKEIEVSQDTVIAEIQNIQTEDKNSNANIEKNNDKNDNANSEKNNDKNSNVNIEKNNNKNLNITEVLKNVDKDKIFYEEVITSENAMFAYRPTIENLYKHADVVVVGKYNSDLKTYATGVNIFTQTKFNVSKVIKNSTNLNVSKSVIFSRNGGVLSLDKYMNNNPTIRDDEFKNIKGNERPNYYIIQEYGPENKLDFTKNNIKNNEYILFLNYHEGNFTLNCSYYGMREINKDNKIYDYDTQKYIKSDLILK